MPFLCNQICAVGVSKLLVIVGFSLLLCYGSQSYSQPTLYNANYSVACHNCYEKKYSKSLEDVFSYTKTIEIDIWDIPRILQKGGGMRSDWFVKHTFLQKGNKNSFGGSLATCFRAINEWSDNHPGHDVISIFVDKKQGWSKRGTRKPEDFDSLLISVFGRDKLYTPGDFAGTSSNLRTALKEYEWASLNSLKGKIIFVLTDATFFRPRNVVLNAYLKKLQENALCFVAPTIVKEDEVAKPKGISTDNAGNIVFYNLDYKNSNLCEFVSSKNYINRVYRAPETEAVLKRLTEKKVNFVALFNYKLESHEAQEVKK